MTVKRKQRFAGGDFPKVQNPFSSAPDPGQNSLVGRQREHANAGMVAGKLPNFPSRGQVAQADAVAATAHDKTGAIGREKDRENGIVVCRHLAQGLACGGIPRPDLAGFVCRSHYLPIGREGHTENSFPVTMEGGQMLASTSPKANLILHVARRQTIAVGRKSNTDEIRVLSFGLESAALHTRSGVEKVDVSPRVGQGLAVRGESQPLDAIVWR